MNFRLKVLKGGQVPVDQFFILKSAKIKRVIKRGEEGQPQKFLVRATSKSSSLDYYVF